MGTRREHNQQRVDAYVRMLNRVGAPASLISKFLSLVEIDSWISEHGYASSLDDLLLDACKFEGYSKPFEINGQKRWLRPKVCGDKTEAYHMDTYDELDDFDPKREQAYRRGYDQGFHEALTLVRLDRPFSELAERAGAIHSWRCSQVYAGPTRPGTAENYTVSISFRRTLSPKLRFDIFERDNFRCKACGKSAGDGITLHVDHIVAVANGGSNDRQNLQTLCDECNIGKGAR